MRVASQLVTLDVGVLSKDGTFIPGLKKEYFRVLEDNVPQTITSFNQIQAPDHGGDAGGVFQQPVLLQFPD